MAPPLVFSSLDLLTGRTFVRLGFCYQEKERPFSPCPSFLRAKCSHDDWSAGRVPACEEQLKVVTAAWQGLMAMATQVLLTQTSSHEGDEH